MAWVDILSTIKTVSGSILGSEDSLKIPKPGSPSKPRRGRKSGHISKLKDKAKLKKTKKQKQKKDEKKITLFLPELLLNTTKQINTAIKDIENILHERGYDNFEPLGPSESIDSILRMQSNDVNVKPSNSLTGNNTNNDNNITATDNHLKVVSSDIIHTTEVEQPHTGTTNALNISSAKPNNITSGRGRGRGRPHGSTNAKNHNANANASNGKNSMTTNTNSVNGINGDLGTNTEVFNDASNNVNPIPLIVSSTSPIPVSLDDSNTKSTPSSSIYSANKTSTDKLITIGAKYGYPAPPPLSTYNGKIGRSFYTSPYNPSTPILPNSQVAYSSGGFNNGSHIEWILCRVLKIISETRFEIQDPEPDELHPQGQIFRANYKEVILIPLHLLSSSASKLKQYKPGTRVLAKYPETTTFYPAEVMETKNGSCMLRFEGEEEVGKLTSVDRVFVLPCPK